MQIAFHASVNTFYEGVVSACSLSRYNHVELIFDKVAPDDKAWFSADGSDGVRFAKGPTLPGKWRHFLLPFVREHDERLMFKWATEHVGDGYDWLGVLRFAIPLIPVPPHPTDWFCSEVCLACLQSRGFFAGHPAHRYSPAALQELIVIERPRYDYQFPIVCRSR